MPMQPVSPQRKTPDIELVQNAPPEPELLRPRLPDVRPQPAQPDTLGTVSAALKTLRPRESSRGEMAGVSRKPGHYEYFWIDTDGSIEHSVWYENDRWRTSRLLPPAPPWSAAASPPCRGGPTPWRSSGSITPARCAAPSGTKGRPRLRTSPGVRMWPRPRAARRTTVASPRCPAGPTTWKSSTSIRQAGCAVRTGTKTRPESRRRGAPMWSRLRNPPPPVEAPSRQCRAIRA